MIAGRSDRAVGYVLALLASAAGGSAFGLGKVALQSVGSLTFSTWLLIVAAPLSFVAGRLLDPGWWPRWPRGRGLVLLLAHAGLSFVSLWTVWEGLKYLDPTVAGFLSRVEVLVLVGLGMVFLGERFGGWAAVGAVVTVLGVVVMAWPQPGAASGESTARGFVLVTLSMLGFGATEMVAKLAVRHVRPADLTALRNVLLAVAFVTVAWPLGALPPPTGRPLLHVVLAAVLGPTLARLLYLRALRRLELSWAALLSQLSPLFTAAVAYLTLRSLPGPLEWVGGAIVVAGSVLLIRGGPGGKPGRASIDSGGSADSVVRSGPSARG
jgi:drug/metabolite transporter (DMT)-like permease